MRFKAKRTMEDNKDFEQEEIYAKRVRAGKRTYFFDVRSTKGNDYFLTITESKRKFNEDGSVHYKKHKIFLYKEDFEKFSDALSDSFQKIIELKQEQNERLNDKFENQFTEVSFDELGDNGEPQEKS
ncbi:MAG: DUF3276 family protein [Salibacter sp.]|nr:DUF3276 family protein [Salibacter sp.]MDR9398467.1 DUF3276 family protein [Salibacter sp.]MDR9487505.1 DUF3276 family protein [Salibacter sp.]